MNLRDRIAVETAKAVAAGSRLLGNQGTSISGKAAMAVAPDILRDLAGQVRKKTFAVCGTNGKTTVNNILCAMLEEEGERVVCNRLGANMPAGVAGAFLSMAGHDGSLDAGYACIEVDEASAVHVFSSLRPDILILTNVFRDQLDRYGEIDITIELLKKAIRLVPEMKLIVNADDPLSVYLAEETGNPFACYGIGDTAYAEKGQEGKEEIRESRFCKKCGSLLAYEYYQYGQMGKWSCPSCAFSRPEPAYRADALSLKNGVSFRIEDCQAESPLSGLYSVYNLLAVWSALREAGCGPVTMTEFEEQFNRVLRNYHPQFGRCEVFHIQGRKVVLNLAKNPAGFNQNIDAMLTDREAKDLIIAINDNDQDGTDISWIWDVDFDRIRDDTIQSVTVSGTRALDMRLRLKYEEIGSGITDTPEEAIDDRLASGRDTLYVLVNYTALMPAHQHLQKKEMEQTYEH